MERPLPALGFSWRFPPAALRCFSPAAFFSRALPALWCFSSPGPFLKVLPVAARTHRLEFHQILKQKSEPKRDFTLFKDRELEVNLMSLVFRYNYGNNDLCTDLGLLCIQLFLKVSSSWQKPWNETRRSLLISLSAFVACRAHHWIP